MDRLFDVYLRWWLHTARYPWSKLRRWLCERKYLEESLPAATSLEEIEARLREVKWRQEGLLHLYDSISYPQTVWAKKRDDCDGFAVLAAELVNRLNPAYNPVMITAIVHPLQEAHTVCAFTNPQGGLWFFDNDILRRDSYSKYENIVTEITKNAERLVCWDVRDPFTFKMLDFRKA
jgi:hypothetical protein